MENALIGIPQDYTPVADGTAVRSIDNLLNDYPGLVYRTANINNGGTKNIDLDVDTGMDPIQAIAILGQPADYEFNITVESYSSSTARTNGTGGTTHVSGLSNAHFSSNRSAETAKFFNLFSAPTTNRFFRIKINNLTGSSRYFEAWKIVLCTVIQPATNIEIGAVITIDDRSERRYTRAGNRVIDPTVICPAFQGQWPWISVSEAHTIRKLMYKKGGTFPCLFVLDPADSDWGEDFVFYGDFEKTLQLDLDNDDLNLFKFAIVSIAP